MSNVSIRITTRDGDQVRSIDIDTFPAAPPVLELAKPEHFAGCTARFIDNGDGTVTDNLTGDMWTKDDATDKAVNFDKAVQACKDCRVGGYDDWELPSRVRLLTLVDDTRHDPAIDKSVFPSCKSEWYWTSTPCAWSPSGFAWFVSFDFGNSGYDDRDFSYRVRAVRRASRQ